MGLNIESMASRSLPTSITNLVELTPSRVVDSSRKPIYPDEKVSMRGIEDLMRTLNEGPLTLGELFGLFREYRAVITQIPSGNRPSEDQRSSNDKSEILAFTPNKS